MLAFAKRSASLILSFLIPPRPSERLLARTSAEELRSLSRPASGLYETLLPYHDPRVKALVWELKYYGNRKARELAGVLLAERVAEIAAEELAPPALVPIPMHASRRRTRGFNHSEDLCEEICSRLGSCTVAPLLHKEQETARQVELSGEARRENLRGAFCAPENAPPLLIVIDDVTTTGATFEEATRALAEANAKRVICLALARS